MPKEDLYLRSTNHDIITLYIRPETDKQKIIDLLKHEEPIIDNIKSRQTREGIKQSFQRVKTFVSSMLPSESGYIIVASPERLIVVNDILVTRDKYYCGNEFYSVPLEEALVAKLNPIGILTLDTKEATLAYISNRVEILKHMTSGISGKHSKGGQSQRRFEREREQEILAFFARIGEATKVFLNPEYQITELILSGCGLTKKDFLKADYLDYRLKEKIKIILDTQYTGEEGIREALHLALPQLEKNAFANELKEVEKVFDLLGRNIDRVVYGKEEIEKNLKHIGILYKLEELPIEYPVKTFIIRFKGEHYDKVKSFGGMIGVKTNG